MYTYIIENTQCLLLFSSWRKEMKKVAVLLLVLVLTISLVTSPVFAQDENAKGVVKANLLGGTYPNWYVVGSVILGITPDGKLIVNVNMDTEPDLEDYNVGVVVWYSPTGTPPGPPEEADFREIVEDVLDTNATGQGNVQVQLYVDPPTTYGSIWVRVYVREDLPAPGTVPEYRSGYPTPIKVPLK